MDNQPPLDEHSQAPLARKNSGVGFLPAQRQYSDMPFPEEFDGPGPGLLEYWQILRRRKGALFLIIVLGLLASLLFTLPQTPIYQARGSIEIQNLNENFLNTRNVSPTANGGDSNAPQSDLLTQAKILQSESLIVRVATKLNLESKLFSNRGSGRLAAWRKTLGLPEGKQASTREKVLALVAANLKVSTDPNTRLVEIRYDSTDPRFAADFVNTLTAEFVQQNVESRFKTTQQTGEWLTRQMEDVRTQLEKSEDELQSYAQASGLVFTDEKDNVTEEKLRELQQELSKAQADRIASQSIYELASTASPESLPEVLDDPTLKEYQVKLTDLRRQLAEVSSSLTSAHPAVKQVQAQVTTLELALDKERTNVTERIRNEFESARRRENLLAVNYASQARLMSDQAAKVSHYNILKSEADTKRQLYDSMLQNVQQAGMTSALGASNIRVVDSAVPPTHPYKPNVALNSGLGLIAGAFLGIALVVVQERTDRTIQRPGDTALYLDVAELGTIPSAGRNRLFAYPKANALKSRNSESGNPSQLELIASSKEPSLLAESFRATLTSILYSGENGSRPRIIVITSANQGEGKTTVASNLALALAEIGQPFLTQSVLLIDGDLRRPRLHQIFGIPNRWGLADLLDGKEAPVGSEGMVWKTAFRNLHLLPAGSPTANATALLHSPRMLELLASVRKEFHTVIIDTPPMLNLPDARIIGRVADAVVLVVQSGQTMRDAALAANQRLAEDGAFVLGTILNRWDPRKSKNCGYAYGNKYHAANGVWSRTEGVDLRR